MTPRRSERLARLLALVPWLQAHPGVTIELAAEQFGVTADELEADLWLLVVCGLPGQGPSDLIDIQFWGDDRVIRVLDAQTLGRPMRLRPDEAVSLLVGLRLLHELPGSFDRAALDSVTAKLEDLAGESAAEAGRRVAVTVHGSDLERRATLDDALQRGRRLHLSYLVPTRDEVTGRDVDPWRVIATGGQAYLEGWCYRADARRTFRFDRILDARVLDAAVEHQPNPDMDDMGESLYRPDAHDPIAIVDLEPRVRWLADYATVESAEERPDGVLRITVRSADLRWVQRLVLGSGGAARVVAPQTLAASVRSDADAALAAYA